MVKQYSDGYYINGAWYVGKYVENISNDEMCIATYVNGCSFADDIAYLNARTYDEPIDTPYIDYTLTAELVLYIIVIIFGLALIFL